VTPALAIQAGNTTAAATPAVARVHVPALDGLRGLAVVLVMAHHFLMNIATGSPGADAFLDFFRAGWFGVDLFFVLSGYLITGILLDAKPQPRAIRNFYLRRSLRIFPLYFAVLAIAGLFARWLMPAATDAPLRGAFPSLLCYVSNFHQAGGGWVEGRYLAFSHLWSLAIEEHFYLLWPWVVTAVSTTRLPAVCFIGFCAVALFRAAFLGPFHGDANAAYLLTPFRCDGLLLGGLVACLHRTRGLDDLRRPAAVIVVGGLLTLVAAIGRFGGLPRPHGAAASLTYSALALFFAALLVLALTSPAVRGLFEAPTLRALGTYSYGLYVFHWLLRPAFLQLMQSETLAGLLSPHLAAVAGLLLWVLATALCVIFSWNFLERPMLRLKDRFTSHSRTITP
jgi:peptidoglycan/LPS O-acetylase OafA/YrhL